jgi:toxin FitB
VSYLLDTNVLSEWRKPRPNAGIVQWLRGVYEDELHISAASVAEIAYGVERLPHGRRRDALAAWLERDIVERFGGRAIAFDERIATAWGRVMALRDAAGAPISVMDAVIAATTLVRGFALVTRNSDDFGSLGLTLINPWRS